MAENPEMSEAQQELGQMTGAFVSALQRNNRKIREDRAIAITEDAHLIYKRQVEDVETSIKRLKRERENLLDMSPTDTTSLVLASDFDAQAFVNKDLEIGLKIREAEIKLEILKDRYKHLFMA